MVKIAYIKGCYHFQEFNEITIEKCKGPLNLNEYKSIVALSTDISNSKPNSKKNLLTVKI